MHHKTVLNIFLLLNIFILLSLQSIRLMNNVATFCFINNSKNGAKTNLLSIFLYDNSIPVRINNFSLFLAAL